VVRLARVLGLAAATAVVLLPGSAVLGSLASLKRKASRSRNVEKSALALLAGSVVWSSPSLTSGVGPWFHDLAQGLLLTLCFFPLCFRMTASAERPITAGVLLGLAVMILIDPPSFGSGSRATGWGSHPNSWAAQALVPAVAIAALRRDPKTRMLALVMGGTVAFASGSRGVLLALLLAAVTLVVVGARGRRPWLAATAIVLVGASLGLSLPRARTLVVDSLQLLAGAPAQSRNLVQAGGQSLGVEVTKTGGNIDDSYLVEKVADYGWARWQFPLILHPGRTYAVYVDFRSDSPTAQIGLWGAGRDPKTRERLDVRYFRRGEAWVLDYEGPLQVPAHSVEPLLAGWQRVKLAILATGSGPIWMWIGPTPHQGEGRQGTKAEIRNLYFGLSGNSEWHARADLQLATIQFLARFSAFSAAWSSFLERPWLGRPEMAFATYYRLHPPGQDIAVPAHAHNIVFQTLYERGLVGLAGLGILITTLTIVGVGNNRRFLAVFVALLVANSFDHVIWSAGMLYSYSAAAAFLGCTLRPDTKS
jgi:hypothetical protein